MISLSERVQDAINEGLEFTGKSKVSGADQANIKAYLIDQVGIDPESFKVTVQGIVDMTDVRRTVIPKTKCTNEFTAKQIGNAVLKYFAKKEPMVIKTETVKKLNKNAGERRGGKRNEKEYWDAKRAEINAQIIKNGRPDSEDTTGDSYDNYKKNN